MEQLEEVMGTRVVIPSGLDVSIPLSPGMKYRHYAPHTPVVFCEDIELFKRALETDQQLKRMVLSRQPLPFSVPHALDWFALNAPNFYALLRQADAASYDQIVIYCDEVILSDLGLMNRILKSAGCS